MAPPLDASTLRRSMELYEEALRRHRDEINSLNVFPIPDGDTGTNMLLTIRTVVQALASDRDGGVPDDLSSVGRAIATSSLLGARGNSGVILSQVLRGLTERLSTGRDVDGPVLARALTHASEEAERAVATLEDGTVLSVLRDAARAAGIPASVGADVPEVLEAALEEGRRSLERTREIQPELRRAHVVDAGGRGIVLLLAALRAAVCGRPLDEPVGSFGPVRVDPGEQLVDAEPEFGFEVQVLVEAPEPAVADLRRRLAEDGVSLVVVGGGGLYNVHVHTDRPDDALALVRDAGSIRGSAITPLRDLAGGCIGGLARAVRVAEQACALVAVAAGAGLEGVFRSLGALVVSGGHGESPSVGQILEAAEAAPAGAVLLLPNDPDVVPAAERAAAAASKDVRVVACTSVPAGLAAGAAFDPSLPVDTNASALATAAAAVRAGEVARAHRAAATRAGNVRPGDWIGTSGGQVVWIGDSPSAAAEGLATELASGDQPELITIVAGDGTADDDAERMAARLGSAFPEAEVQVVHGGQPRVPYLLGVE